MTSFLGGTTPATGESAAAVATMDKTYGFSPVTRLYCSGALTAPAVTNRKVAGSFVNPTGLDINTANEYWRLFFIHEINSKVKKGTKDWLGRPWTVPNWQTEMRHLITLGIPNLSVCLTSYLFVDPTQNPDDYLVPGITYYGIDFDGISNVSSYHDYTKALDKVNAWAATHGITVGVPEFGANRATAIDPDDSKRAAWCDTWVNNFIDSGFEYVCWWESENQSGSQMLVPKGTDAVKRLIARSTNQ